MSIINLDTINELEKKLGKKIAPSRFRANLLIDNGKAWEEFDWVGKKISLGESVLEIFKKTQNQRKINIFDPKTSPRFNPIFKKVFKTNLKSIFLTPETPPSFCPIFKKIEKRKENKRVLPQRPSPVSFRFSLKASTPFKKVSKTSGNLVFLTPETPPRLYPIFKKLLEPMEQQRF